MKISQKEGQVMLEIINLIIDCINKYKKEEKERINQLYKLTEKAYVEYFNILYDTKENLKSGDFTYSEALKNLHLFTEKTSYMRALLKSKVLCNCRLNELEGDLKLFYFSIIGIVQGGFHRRVFFRIGNNKSRNVYNYIRNNYEQLIEYVDGIEFNEQGTEKYHVIKDIIKKDKERWMFDNLEDELTKDIAYQLSAIYESWIVCNVTFDRLIQSF